MLSITLWIIIDFQKNLLYKKPQVFIIISGLIDWPRNLSKNIF